MRNLETIAKELKDVQKERDLLNKKQAALENELATMHSAVYSVLEEARDYA